MDSVINLEPRSLFPCNPSEGDLCIVGAQGNHHIFCLIDRIRVQLDAQGDKTNPSE